MIINMWNGDCLELMKKIENNSIDLILTDPPYGTTACKWDVIIPFEDMWKEINRIIKPEGTVCLFGTEPFSSMLRVSNIKNYKYDWYWHKNKSTNFLNAKKQPLRNIEMISVFNKGKYFPIKSEGHKPVNSFTKNTGDGTTVGKTKKGFKGGGQTDRCPTQYLNFKVINNDGSGGNKFHPTQKPVELLKYLIETYSTEGDSVLDFTAGSFSTGEACILTNRNFIGIELSKEFFNTGKDRLMKYKNKNTKFIIVD